jgi:hypothetical protein
MSPKHVAGPDIDLDRTKPHTRAHTSSSELIRKALERYLAS